MRVDLGTDDCVIDGKEFFIRGCLEIPIIGMSESFVWGVWVSLSRKNFEKFVELYDAEGRENEEPFFGWLCSVPPGYPDIEFVKTMVHLRPIPTRPYIELEPTDHPLALEQRNGITIDRVKEITQMILHPNKTSDEDATQQHLTTHDASTTQNFTAMSEEDSLTKVHIDLPNHWATGGESLWALPLGDDLYEIRNTPFHAYGLNWGDIVRAHSADPTLKPEVQEVVAPSGNRTLRVFLNKRLSQEEQDAILSSLQYLNISWADDYYVAIDVHPESDYQAVCDRLMELEQEGTLVYETCEAREPGSFDDVPSEDES